MNEPVKESTAAGTTVDQLDETLKNTITALNNELHKKSLCPDRINALSMTLKTLIEIKLASVYLFRQHKSNVSNNNQ